MKIFRNETEHQLEDKVIFCDVEIGNWLLGNKLDSSRQNLTVWCWVTNIHCCSHYIQESCGWTVISDSRAGTWSMEMRWLHAGVLIKLVLAVGWRFDSRERECFTCWCYVGNWFVCCSQGRVKAAVKGVLLGAWQGKARLKCNELDNLGHQHLSYSAWRHTQHTVTSHWLLNSNVQKIHFPLGLNQNHLCIFVNSNCWLIFLLEAIYEIFMWQEASQQWCANLAESCVECSQVITISLLLWL